MRVAFVCRSFYPRTLGGMERYATFLANAMVAQGCAVDMLCAQHMSDPVALQIKADIPIKFTVVPIPHRRLRAYLDNLSYCQNCCAYINATGEYDLVYWNGGAVGRVQGLPSVGNPIGLEVFLESSPLIRLYQSMVTLPMRWYYPFMDRVISMGGGLTDHIVRFLRVPRERIVEVYNSVDLDYIEAQAKQVVEAIPLHAQTTFLFVGRLVRNKGVDVLVQALNRIADRYDIELLLVGEGPEEARIRSLIGNARVRFLRRLTEPQLFDLYGRIDALTFSCIHGGQPTVIIEAMACGRPIIASDIDGIPPLVQADNGFLVQPGDVAGMAEAMERFLHLSAERRRQMGAVSQRRVHERFTWQIAAAQTLRVFEEVMAHRR